MDPICNGTFLLVSAENAVEANMALGVPRQDAETMSDPRSKVRHDIEVEGNHIKWQFVYPTAPKYNHTYNMQLGQTLELQEPISLSITAQKDNGHTFCCEMVAGSKKSTYVVTFSREGCTTQGCIDGISFTMVFARKNPEMDPICNGSFLMVSNENALEAYMLMGVPKEEARLMADPACKSRYEVEVDGNLIRWEEIYPAAPKYNHTYIMKLNETVTVEMPIAMNITATKKNGRAFSCNFAAGAKQSSCTVTFSPEGFTTKGKNGDTEYTIVFARQEPEMCGMFLLEDNKSLVDMLVGMGKPRAPTEEALSWLAVRITEKDGLFHHQEIFSIGGMLRTFRLGEEFENINEEFFEEPEVGIVTSDFPGSFTMVSKPPRGPPKTTKWRMTRKGMVSTSTDGTNSCEMSFKRIPDIMGRWNLVVKEGVEAQLEAIGVSGPAKDKMVANYVPTFLEVKALGGGRWSWIGQPKDIRSDIEFAIKEEYSYCWAGQTIREIASYKPDMSGLFLVGKVGERVIKTDMTVTKNFLVMEIEYKGIENTRAACIFTRA